jgi:tetratricopeptide (TPR) repeat protein
MMRSFRFHLAAVPAAALMLCVLATADRPMAQSVSELTTVDRQVRELAEVGKYDEANALAERALADAERRFGPDDAEVGDRLVALAAIHRMQGRDAEAQPIMQRALSIYERTLPPVSLDGLSFPWAYQFLDEEKKLLFRREQQKAQERRQ